MVQPYKMVRLTAQPSGLMMYNAMEQKSVLMTAAMLDGGLKTVIIQRQLKSFVEVTFNSSIQSAICLYKAKEFLMMDNLF